MGKILDWNLRTGSVSKELGNYSCGFAGFFFGWRIDGNPKPKCNFLGFWNMAFLNEL